MFVHFGFPNHPKPRDSYFWCFLCHQQKGVQQTNKCHAWCPTNQQMSRVALKRFLEWMKVCLMTFVSKSEHDVSKNDLVNLTFIFYGDVFVAKTQRNGFVKWRHFWITERGFHQAGSPPINSDLLKPMLLHIYIYIYMLILFNANEHVRKLDDVFSMGILWGGIGLRRPCGDSLAKLVPSWFY